MDVARRLVQGVDLWLNNPAAPWRRAAPPARRPPSTAPRTSAPSTAGGRRPTTAATAGPSVMREYASLEEQDTEDAESLYTTLESSIVPLLRPQCLGRPEGWVAMKGGHKDRRPHLQHAAYGPGLCARALPSARNATGNPPVGDAEGLPRELLSLLPVYRCTRWLQVLAVIPGWRSLPTLWNVGL